MVNNFYSESMSRSESSSPINSDVSIDINDDDEDLSQSPKRDELSPPIVQNGSVNCNKSSKLSFSISRLLGANNGSKKHNQIDTKSEGEPEFLTSQSSVCTATESSAKTSHNPFSHPISSENKYSSATNRVTMSPYETALSHLTGTHYQWFGSTPTTLIRDGLQSMLL